MSNRPMRKYKPDVAALLDEINRLQAENAALREQVKVEVVACQKCGGSGSLGPDYPARACDACVIRALAIADVLQERRRQDAKWGEQNNDDKTFLTVLMEEVGEVAQAVLHDEFGGAHAGTVRAELVQVAAVAVAFIECIDRRPLPELPEVRE